MAACNSGRGMVSCFRGATLDFAPMNIRWYDTLKYGDFHEKLIFFGKYKI